MSNKRDFAADSGLLRIGGIAIVIGALSVVVAWVLLNLIYLFTNLFFFQTFSFASTSPAGHQMGAAVIAVPIVGSIIVGLIARYGSDKIRGHGIPEALEAILFSKSKMQGKVALLKPISSAIVIGSGGPFGAEGPIIMTGGALGSLIAQHFHLTAAERKTLLVAGASAGMTAVFSTPLAAILLAVELMLFEWRPRSLVPVALASTVAAFLRPVLLDAGPLFPLQTSAPHAMSLLICIVAGLLSGVLAATLSSALYKVEDAFHALPVHWMWWPAIGGIAVGIGGWLQPRALGVGYDVIGDLLQGHLALGIVAALLLVKCIIWVIALGSGTSGGVLAPLLMMGAGLGTLLSYLLPAHDAALWPLVCMAAMLAGTMGSPLMAAAFALELTHDANALLPVLLACIVSYALTVLVMKRSILTEKIARRGHHIYREYGVDPMERTFASDILTKDVIAIPAATTVAEAAERWFGAQQRFRSYPVTAEGGRFVGILDRDLLQQLQQAHPAEAVIGGLLAAMPGDHALIATPDQTCRVVAAQLAVHRVERIAVVNDAQERRLIGLISRSDLIKTSLRFFEEEHPREKLIHWLRRGDHKALP
ncbi:MAG: chloride channel protein [Burkholderiaceae bacterium]